MTEVDKPARESSRVRAGIKRSAAQLVAERGYHSTSLRQLATASGITLGTLYHYFPSKEDLLAELFDDAMRPLLATIEGIEGRAEADPVAALREMVESFIVVTLKELGSAIVLIADNELRALSGPRLERAVAQRDEYEQAMTEVVECGRRQGVFAVQHVKLTVYAILAICNSVPRWYRPHGPMSIEETARVNALLALRLVGITD